MPVLAARPRAHVTKLFLQINRTLYAVRALECDPMIAHRGFRLHKPDGTLYDVTQTRYGPQCDCPDFVFRRDGIDPDGCKHVRALVAEGLIEAAAPTRAGSIGL